MGGPATRTLTYEDVATRVARIASGLALAGAHRGGRIAICTENRIDYALVTFAAVRVGCIAIPLHHHSKASEVGALVKRSHADLLVVDEAIGRVAVPSGVKTLVYGDTLDEAVASAVERPPAAVTAKSPALILFTSGTTGAPKGATLTSRSLLAVARLAALVPNTQDELGVSGLPLAHVMGMSTLLCAAMAGARLHWLTKFDAKVVLDRIEALHATFFVGVPTMYAMLAEQRPERRDLSTVKLFASGADAMPPPLVERFRRLGCAQTAWRGAPLLTAAFAEVYGMVELSGPAVVKFTPPQPVEGTRTGRAQAALKRLGQRLTRSEPDAPSPAVGIPIPPYRARVVDAEGKPVKAGDVGELVLKGPGVTKGYDADAEATARSTRDGWLFTGDLARRNRLGLIAFVTRKKDVIKHGGFSVFPAEVEAQLSEHPAVAEAVVFGAPHATKGAVPVAAIVLRAGAHATERELLDWSRHNIAPFKAPRALTLISASDVPRNANKKVLKDALREQLLAKLVAQLHH